MRHFKRKLIVENEYNKYMVLKQSHTETKKIKRMIKKKEGIKGCRKETLFGFTAQVSCRNWKPHIPESMSDSVQGERGSSSVLIVRKGSFYCWQSISLSSI